MTSSSSPAWPDEFAPLDAATAWVERHANSNTHARVRCILRNKLWGCTAAFDTDSGPVVLKIAAPSLFPQAHLVQRAVFEAAPFAVPELIDWEDIGGQRWSLFAHIDGAPVRKEGADGVVAAAALMGAIQRATAGQLPDSVPVPAASVADLLCDLDDQPPELVGALDELRTRLREWGEELDAAVPSSIDHVDFHVENVMRAADGRLVILDWEEAVVSCPLFTFDRFRIDAEDHGVGALAERAYLRALLPHTSEPDRLRWLGMSAALAPLKAAAEAREFAAALGWSNPHTALTTRMIERSVAAAGTDSPRRSKRVADVRIERLYGGAGDICRAILDTLPTWFGMPDANAEYLASAERGESYVAYLGDRAVGLLLPVRHSDAAAEIGLLAVAANHRRAGVGRTLLSAYESDLAADGVKFLQVKTLSARRLDDGYDETRAFYRAVGFVHLEEHPLLWNETNPALQLIKALDTRRTVGG